MASGCGGQGGESTSSGQGRAWPASSRVQGVESSLLTPMCAYGTALVSWTVGPPTLWFC